MKTLLISALTLGIAGVSAMAQTPAPAPAASIVRGPALPTGPTLPPPVDED